MSAKQKKDEKAQSIILTRNKSAQQHRQLRKKDKTVPSLAQLLKRPPKNVTGKSPKTKNTDTPKKNERGKDILNTDENCTQEYYPNKIKRNVNIKKVMLKPKYNLTVIATTNKRKLGTPVKGLKSPPPLKKSRQNSRSKRLSTEFERTCNTIQELTMPDIVRMMEDTHSLNDEDLMEILTCPSPVWWEDPPDERYEEDSIGTTGATKTKGKANTKDNSSQNVLTKVKGTNNPLNIEPTVKKKDKVFIEKQTKLENVLGCIKKKGTKNLPHNIEVRDIVDKSSKKEIEQRNSETEADELSDASFNEEEILKHLENMNIPIAGPDTSSSQFENMETSTEDSNLEETKPSDCNSPVIEKGRDYGIIKDELQNTTSKNLPEVNTGKSMIKNEPDSFEGKNIDNLEIGQVVPENQSESIKLETSVLEKSVDSKTANKDSELVTIYKILTNNNVMQEIKKTQSKNEKLDIDSVKTGSLDLNSGNLDSFFKKCKSSKRPPNVKHDPETKIIDIKTTDKNVNSDNKIIKYCRQCSSIFDTAECVYCFKKKNSNSVKELNNDSSQNNTFKIDVDEKFVCDACDYFTKSKKDIRKHMLRHGKEITKSCVFLNST